MAKSLATLLLILLAVVGGPCVILIGAIYGQVFGIVLGVVLMALPLLLAGAINNAQDVAEFQDEALRKRQTALDRPLIPPAPGEAPPDRD